MTGVHQPGESHFELLRAFADDALLHQISMAFSARGYRPHEFGDSMLIEHPPLPRLRANSSHFAYMSLRLGGWDRRFVQNHSRSVPQLGRLGSTSARGCGPCQGAARSVGVSVLDEGRPVNDLSAPFVVTGN